MNRSALGVAWLVVSILLGGILPVVAASRGEKEKLGMARKLFERYISLAEAFDPAAADLYEDAALIKNKRTYPNGKIEERTIPAPQYKDLIRQIMPVAKARGDLNKYTKVKYSIEGDRVRINATRYSVLKKYSSPFSLLVGPGPEGHWLIYEEISESRP